MMESEPSSNGRSPPGKAARRGPSQASQLVAMAQGVTLWHGPTGEAFATVPVNGHRENWPIRSRGFKLWLGRQYHSRAKRTPSAQALADALATLEGKALFDGLELPVFVRVGEHDGCIYLDLANETWETVAVTSAGWRIVPDCPVKFRRARGMLALPRPERGGCVDALRPFLNLPSDDDWRLAVAWLLAAMRARGPYPVLVLSAEQGSGKSTVARMLRSLIDANEAALRCEPREPRDLAIAANNGWVISLDNISTLPPWLSDGLCRLATGGGFATRELFSDAEETILSASRPVCLNGIEDVATRADLLDRAIIVRLPAIPEEQRRTEAELWQAFNAAAPRILGALLSAVSSGLRALPSVRLERTPRMADFARWAAACEPGLGWPRGAFLDSYTGNVRDANTLALEASSIAGPLLTLLSRGAWEGTAAELLDELAAIAGEKLARSSDWPKRPHALAGRVKRLAPNLRRAGYTVEFERLPGGARTRLIRLGNADTAPEPITDEPDWDAVNRELLAADCEADDTF